MAALLVDIMPSSNKQTSKPNSDQVFLAIEGAESLEDAYLFPVSRIQGYEDQPRAYFDEKELGELASSIKRKHAQKGGVGGTGFIHPILVRWAPGAITEQGTIKKNAKVIVIAGEKRLHAAKRAGLERVPVNVVDENEENAYEDAVTENLMRGDMTPEEIGLAFQFLMNKHSFKKYTQLARYLYDDINRADYIRGHINMLELGEDAGVLVTQKKESAVAARRIATIKDEAARRDLIEFMAGGGTVRELEKKIKAYRNESGYAAGQKRATEPINNSSPNSTTPSTTLGTPKTPGILTIPRFNLENAFDVIDSQAKTVFDAMKPPVELSKKQRKQLLKRTQEAHQKLEAIAEFLMEEL